MKQDVRRPKDEEKDTDIAVHSKKGGVDTRKIVRFHQSVFIDQQKDNGGNSSDTQRAEVEREHEPE